MRIGTRSVLFGAHAVWLHGFVLAEAWRELYGFPRDPRLWAAFFLHDIGYWNKTDLEGASGETHVYAGARIMTALFGSVWGEFCLRHSRYWAKKHGGELSRLAAADFKPREVAYVESPVNLPEKCEGTARISQETPVAIDVSLEMTTPGLVVLTDRWDPGWNARYNGARVPMLRVDHALRGVVVPAGVGNLQFRYEPLSFTRGLQFAALSALILLFWGATLVWGSILKRHTARS